jgi:uncharacterized protein DUF5924
VTDPRSATAPRLPLVGWLGGWPISIFSLVLGLAVLLVFRRGLPHVGWIVGYLLLLWLLFVLITELRAPLSEGGRGLVLSAADYTIQTLYHNLLLFVLPAYYAAATLDSRNVVFPALVAAGALVTALDPVYRRLVAPRPWLNHALLGFSVFAALNVALPLVGVQPILALEVSAVMAALALAPAFRREGLSGWLRAHALALAAAALALVLVWFARGLVPPARPRPRGGRARRGRAGAGGAGARWRGARGHRARVGGAGRLHRGLCAGRRAAAHHAHLVARPAADRPGGPADAGAGRPARGLPHVLALHGSEGTRRGSLSGRRRDGVRPAHRAPALHRHPLRG